MPEKFYLTTPIYYVNARPHIGHAYTTIVADVLARRARAQGLDTFFLTGTDEHGQKIERSALAAGVPPQVFADGVSRSFRALWDRMGITYSDFIRTTEPRHHRAVQKLFRALQANGHIYLSSYTGQYCVSEETFVDGPPGTIGPDGRPTETVTEENYFFRLSAFQQPVIDLIESGRLTIEPESRRNEVLSFLRSGLKDLSISRSSFTWGIPVPTPGPVILTEGASAPQSTDLHATPSQPHVIYVWLDALANYMTAVGYGSDDPLDEARFKHYWPADLHIVGKEIIRFHCVYWPAFLLAAGLPTPKKVVAHGWLLFEESKMSKSRGNIVRTETILDAFGTLCPPSPSGQSPVILSEGAPAPQSSDLHLDPATTPVILSEAHSAQSKDPEASHATPSLHPFPPPTPDPTQPTPHDRDIFAADVLRYFLLREIPFGQDGSFSFDALITRYNADLANGYGNLVRRVLTMIQDNFTDGIPIDTNFASADNAEEFARFALEGPANLVVSHVNRCVGISRSEALATAFNVLLAEVSLAITVTDKYISDNAPWKLAKTPGPEAREKLTDTLYTAAESIRIITALLYPILPYATALVWRQLGLGSIEEAAANGDLNNLHWGGLQPGTRLSPLSPIFPRADKGLAQIMTDMESQNTRPAPPIPSADRSETLTPDHHAPTDPAAGPRTATFAEPSPGLQVAGSTAATTERNTQSLGAPFMAESHPDMSGSTTSPQPADASPQITIDDFAKVELRVAQVVLAERIPKADKLLRLEVDLGYERRQILSGIAEWYTPEDLLGRRIVVITNLAPRKMRGLESHGMLLAASSEGGKPALATFLDSDTLPLGSRLK